MIREKNKLFILINFLYLSVNAITSAQHQYHHYHHRCVLNPYYHPVCGTDMRSYPNRDILECLNQQRPRERLIHAIYNRECDPLICPSVHDLQGPWPATSPVCASNGYTYGHIHQVRCLRDYHSGIQVVHEGGCTIHEVARILGRNSREKACAERRRHFEINPVCTSHNRTFANPFAALCQYPAVPRQKLGGACGAPKQKSCEAAERLQKSLQSATGNENIRFIVCGSDLKTYRSEHHLECSKHYNPNLYVLHYGRCTNFNNICPDKLKHIQTASPVCGTDNYSYTSFEALLCARYRMNKNLNFLHSGACIRT